MASTVTADAAAAHRNRYSKPTDYNRRLQQCAMLWAPHLNHTSLCMRSSAGRVRIAELFYNTRLVCPEQKLETWPLYDKHHHDSHKGARGVRSLPPCMPKYVVLATDI